MSLENPNIVEKAKYQDLALFGKCRIVFMKKNFKTVEHGKNVTNQKQQTAR